MSDSIVSRITEALPPGYEKFLRHHQGSFIWGGWLIEVMLGLEITEKPVLVLSEDTTTDTYGHWKGKCRCRSCFAVSRPRELLKNQVKMTKDEYDAIMETWHIVFNSIRSELFISECWQTEHGYLAFIQAPGERQTYTFAKYRFSFEKKAKSGTLTPETLPENNACTLYEFVPHHTIQVKEWCDKRGIPIVIPTDTAAWHGSSLAFGGGKKKCYHSSQCEEVSGRPCTSQTN